MFGCFGQQTEINQRAELFPYLPHGFDPQFLEVGPTTFLGINQDDTLAGASERQRDSTPHASGAERGDCRRLHKLSPRVSSVAMSARESPAKPSASRVRLPWRRSLPQTADATASKPVATGADTPAQSATETRKASP